MRVLHSDLCSSLTFHLLCLSVFLFTTENSSPCSVQPPQMSPATELWLRSLCRASTFSGLKPLRSKSGITSIIYRLALACLMPPFGENFKKNISLLAFSMGCIPSHLSSQIHFFQTPQFRRLSGKFIISISKPDGLLSAGSLRKGWQWPFRWNKLLHWQHSTIVIEFDIGVKLNYFKQNAVNFYI